MARQAHTPAELLGPTGYAGVTVTFTASSASSSEECVVTGREIILAQNSSSASAQTVTVNSVVDPYGRTKDIAADSIPANGFKAYGPFDRTGWMQSGGSLYFEASNATVKFSVLRLPAGWSG
jgi:hypothetical protein